MTFEEPDLERFPCLGLAYRALKTGGTMPVALNAANEVAVAAFLDGELKLNEIAQTIEGVLNSHSSGPADSLEAVLAADSSARAEARKAFTAGSVSAGAQSARLTQPQDRGAV